MQIRNYREYELRAHTIAFTLAILGPLFNLILGINFATAPPGMYLYWAACLSIYILVLIPFTHKNPLILIKLIFLGVLIEDFSSNVWRSLFFGKSLLPFCNWYTEHFPFLGSLGQPTPIILIPRWYFVSLSLYGIITILQQKLIKFRREI